MTEQRSCWQHGDFDGARLAACADEAFQSALDKNDHAALATELEARLRASHNCYATGFRSYPGGPIVWRKPHWDTQTEPPWKQWAAEAATAILEAKP
jgi:hypothetical protein